MRFAADRDADHPSMMFLCALLFIVLLADHPLCECSSSSQRGGCAAANLSMVCFCKCHSSSFSLLITGYAPDEMS